MHLFFLLLIISFNLQARELKELARDPKWIRLLHYRGGVSEADDPQFFLSKDGKRNPFKELEAAVKTFPTDQSAVCKFPLRAKWLNRELGNPWKLDFSQCQHYLEFFSKLAAKRASIVFSSYYLSNPNTAFGHTLLRLSRYDDKNETEMLDYGINYSAETGRVNPFVYAWKGLLGGFKGRFAAIPYYYKIREYSDAEFRDLWSYELNLSQAEVLEMVDHIWELGSTYFDYFYFKENCSYHLLSLLEVVRPNLKLTDRYTLFAIPADTIRLLKEEGLIDEGKMRESTYSRLMRMSEKLSSPELVMAKKFAEDPKTANAKVDARILDVALEAFDYKNAEKILMDDKKVRDKKHPLLIARAMNPEVSKEETPKQVLENSPARSHAPSRAGFFQGYEHLLGNRTRLEVRAALHDLLDPQAGSLKAAQLEIGKVGASFARDQFRLDDLTFVTIRNFPQQNFWASPMSWEVEAGLRQLNRVECFDCPGGRLMGSLGNTIGMGNFLAAMLVNSELEFHSYYQENYRLGAGPKIVLRYLFSDKLVASWESYYHLNSYSVRDWGKDQDLVSQLETRYYVSSKLSVSLRGGVKDQARGFQGMIESGLYYFY